MPLQFPIKWEYDTIAYRMAATKKELCSKTRKVPLSEDFEQHPKFQVKHRYYSRCYWSWRGLPLYVGWMYYRLFQDVFLCVRRHQLNSTSQDYCMAAKASNIFICPKKILGKSNKRNKMAVFINRKFSEHSCCNKKAAAEKKKKKSRSRDIVGQRLVSVSSSKKKKKRKKKNRSQKKKKSKGKTKKKNKN